MKIQKQLSKKIGDKIYHKHVIVIPNDLLKKAKLKGGDELEVEIKEGGLKLKKKQLPTTSF